MSDGPAGVPSQVRQIALLMRGIPAEMTKFPWLSLLWGEDRAGRYLIDALHIGAFPKEQWRDLRHEIDARLYPSQPGGKPGYGNAFYAVVEWLQSRGKIPPYSSERFDEIFEKGCAAVADLIETRPEDFNRSGESVPAYEKEAYLSYAIAIQEQPALASRPLREIHKWIISHGVEVVGKPYTPPDFKTWSRYRRSGERRAKPR